MKERDLITAIDLGSSKIAVIVGNYVDGEVNVEGYGTGESAGIRGGVVVDLKSAAECISEALEKAEKTAGVEISSAFVGVSGQHIRSLNSEGEINISTGQEEVEAVHLKGVMSKAKVEPPSLGMEMLHTLPSEFLLDGVGGVKNPLGLSCKELKVKVTSIAALTTAVQNILRCADLAELEVEQIILNIIADGEVVLYPEEKDLGVGLIDIGAHLTDIGIYRGEYPLYASALPYGGENLSRDIATHFHISLKEAERIKKIHGICLRYLLEGNKEITVEEPSALKSGSKDISKLALSELLEEKCEKFVSNISRRIEPFIPHLGSGIVITGGGSRLLGLKEMLEEKTGLPVRTGSVKKNIVSNSSRSNADFLSSSSPDDTKLEEPLLGYTTAMGIVVFAQYLKEKEKKFPWEKESLYDKTVGKVVNLIKNFF
jgi:cell division protein FtsA